jgi:hypothetical protein
MKLDCPTCKKEIEWDENNPNRPFCCERCRLIDLGAWASEEFRVPAEPVDPNDLPVGEDGPGREQ